MLLRLDGQAHYDTSYFPAKYSTVSSAKVVWSVVAEGPDSANCIKRTNTASGGGQGYLEMAPLMSQSGAWTPNTSGVCGFKFEIDDLTKLAAPAGPGNGTNAIFRVLSGGQDLFTVQLNPNGTFTVVRPGFAGAALGNSSEGFQNGVWHNFECQWVISHTVGSVRIVVDRVEVLTLTGQNTWGIPNTTTDWNSVRFLACEPASGDTSLVMRIAQIYLADLTGGANDIKDFQRSWSFTKIIPDGVGSSDDYVATGATDNWDTQDDDAAPDGDSTYVSGTDVGLRDMYTMTDVPTDATILGFQTVILPRLEADGSVGLQPSVRLSGVNYDATEQGVASTAYDAYLMQPYDTNPATGAKITPAELNAAEFGDVKSA